MADKKTENKNKLPDHSHNHHRKHMRERFYEAGFRGMADHNVLEMLLYNGIPRKDTNEIAHELMNRFGSYAGVFEANINDLVKVKGMTENAACLIKMIVPFYNRYVEDLTKRKPSPIIAEDVADFLRPKFYEGSCRERVFVLCYDSTNHLVTCRLLNEGDFCSSAFDIREFARIVLETNCSSVIISHNHPHSISLPSNTDIKMTKAVINFLETLKVRLRDHIIVSDTGFTSMAEHKLTMPMFYGIELLEDVEKNGVLPD